MTSELIAFVLARDDAGRAEMGRVGVRAVEEVGWLGSVIGWSWGRAERWRQ